MTRRSNFKLNWKYALGEVLLIFIGISLAIAFQNWNDSRKDRRKVNGYLSTIADNVASDSVEISRFILIGRQKTQAGERYIASVKAKTPTLDAFMAGLLQLDEEYLNLNTNGFEGLKASGFLSDIQGKGIEEALFNYYSFFEEIHEEESGQNQYIAAQELEFVKNAATSEFMIMVTDISLKRRDATLSSQEQRMLEQIYDHPSLISVNLRAGFITNSYYELMRRGSRLRALISERLAEK